MKRRTIAIIATVGLMPLVALTQTPPTPPTPPTPAAPAVPAVPAIPGRERGPKVPVTYLGVETSDVPSVVAEQLGLPKGFGLVVDYVVPDGPAATAGVQPNDILRMLNDQILVEPDQLAKLVRSFKEGDSVTLTVLRKGAETKLSAKLQKRDVPQHREEMFERGNMRHPERFGLGPEFQEQMKNLGEQMKNMQIEKIDETVKMAREQARRARDEARQRIEEARAARDNIRVITTRDNGAVKTTRIDMGKAQISYNDSQGEMNLEMVNGKKVLTAKDREGRLLFSGPVETKEELDKLPPEVRQRYEQLETKDLPAVAPTMTRQEKEEDNDNDADDDNDGENADVVHVRSKGAPHVYPYRRFDTNWVRI
ncbi:MAG TPA: PDZ domain-containing protein [Chthoniobacterales bacterium]